MLKNQFSDLYPACLERKLTVMGGTCASVGVGGCWLGGCYGTFSNVHGSAASNVLSARVVLADGSLVTANATENPDLYWSLKGGGGGLGGVVTEWTARTYPAPTHTVRAGVNAFAADAKALEVLLEQLLITAHRFTSSSPFWGSVGVNAKRLPGGQGFNAGVSAQGWQLKPNDAAPLLAPLLKWIEEEKPVNISRAEEYHGGWSLDEWQRTFKKIFFRFACCPAR